MLRPDQRETGPASVQSDSALTNALDTFACDAEADPASGPTNWKDEIETCSLLLLLLC